MHTARWSLSVLSVVAASACSPDRAPTNPQLPSQLSLSASSSDRISASGGGIVDLSAVVGASDAHFSFNAAVKANGEVHGRFHQRRERNGLVVDFSGNVTCLTVEPVLHRARIGGVITENNSTDPAFLTENHQVGDDVWFRVEDGGEGAGAIDASTTYGFKPTLVDTSEQYCALPFTGLPFWNPASTFPLRSGNIQVKP